MTFVKVGGRGVIPLAGECGASIIQVGVERVEGWKGRLARHIKMKEIVGPEL